MALSQLQDNHFSSSSSSFFSSIVKESSIGAAASAMGNIGPAFGEFGPTDNYAMMPKLGKWVLAFCMLLGRLEIFTVMVLFSKTFWK